MTDGCVLLIPRGDFFFKCLQLQLKKLGLLTELIDVISARRDEQSFQFTQQRLEHLHVVLKEVQHSHRLSRVEPGEFESNVHYLGVETNEIIK